MKIDAIEIYRLAVPIIGYYKTAFARAECFNSILVKLISGKNYGWGEAAPWGFPGFCGECDLTAYQVAKTFIAPLLLDQDIESGKALQQKLAGIKENNFAKAAFDLAWWDLYAKEQKTPLWKLIGGENDEAEGGAAIGALDSIDLLMEEVQKVVDAGYPRIKLKYCPGWELEMLRALRKNFPNVIIHIDCNSAYTLADLDMFKKLDACNLAMIEQPLMHDDLLDHATLQSKIGTPICLDESITSADKARKAIQLKACKWINIKHGRVGGITNALLVHDICKISNIPCWIGSMGESAIGYAFSLALATLPNIKYPSDILPSSRYYEKDLGYPVLQNPVPGKFIAFPVPGIGVEPDPEMLANTSVEKTFAGKA
jgi:O-succinylbenzoate synthase